MNITQPAEVEVIPFVMTGGECGELSMYAYCKDNFLREILIFCGPCRNNRRSNTITCSSARHHHDYFGKFSFLLTARLPGFSINIV
jgi:hypothetical protein